MTYINKFSLAAMIFAWMYPALVLADGRSCLDAVDKNISEHILNLKTPIMKYKENGNPDGALNYITDELKTYIPLWIKNNCTQYDIADIEKGLADDNLDQVTYAITLPELEIENLKIAIERSIFLNVTPVSYGFMVSSISYDHAEGTVLTGNDLEKMPTRPDLSQDIQSCLKTGFPDAAKEVLQGNVSYLFDGTGPEAKGFGYPKASIMLTESRTMGRYSYGIFQLKSYADMARKAQEIITHAKSSCKPLNAYVVAIGQTGITGSPQYPMPYVQEIKIMKKFDTVMPYMPQGK